LNWKKQTNKQARQPFNQNKQTKPPHVRSRNLAQVARSLDATSLLLRPLALIYMDISHSESHSLEIKDWYERPKQ